MKARHDTSLARPFKRRPNGCGCCCQIMDVPRGARHLDRQLRCLGMHGVAHGMLGDVWVAWGCMGLHGMHGVAWGCTWDTQGGALGCTIPNIPKHPQTSPNIPCVLVKRRASHWHPQATPCIPMHPNASQCIPMHPNASQCIPKHRCASRCIPKHPCPQASRYWSLHLLHADWVDHGDSASARRPSPISGRQS